MKRYVIYSGVLLLVVVIAIQFIPVKRTNRLGAGDPQASREVQWILRRACYDCHSTETRWPIWAYIAPVSWQVVADVNRARQFLNFNDWAAYDATQQRVMRQNIERVTATHKMPLWYYLTLHPDARLNAHDTRVLHGWTRGDSTTLR